MAIINEVSGDNPGAKAIIQEAFDKRGDVVVSQITMTGWEPDIIWAGYHHICNDDIWEFVQLMQDIEDGAKDLFDVTESIKEVL